MSQTVTTSPASDAASPRRIAALALPALVVLAAEPLYVLVDTAVVGHLGRVPLAALAVGGTVMTLTAWLGTVVAYGTTGRSARRFGSGDRGAAVAEGVQASWLALAVGVLVALAMQLGGGVLARTLVGGSGDVAGAAAQWLRIAALGAPGLLLAAAGNGWLRGIQDTRRPLLFVLAPNLLSALLCPLLVYPAGLGLAGSAMANAAAQTLSGGLFAAALVRERVSLRAPAGADPAAARAQPGPADPGRRLPGELPVRHRRRRPVRRRRRRRPPDRPAALVLHRPAAGRAGHRRPVADRRRARRGRRGRRPRPRGGSRWSAAPAGSPSRC